MQLSFAVTRVMSRERKLRQFVHVCAVHGITRFRTQTGKCLECDPSVPGRPVINPDRSRARAANLPTYIDYCPIHITVPHSVASGKCLTCFTTAGTFRAALAIDKTSLRFKARTAGRKTYDGFCRRHGPTPYGVRHGKCLKCFTFGGAPREYETPGGPLQDDNPRAVARREHKTSYVGRCEIHDNTAHSVRHGGCLTCFTSAGMVRGVQDADTARAAARRAGLTTFEGLCATHGKTPHSVRHGGCLTCLNAYGVPRRRPS